MSLIPEPTATTAKAIDAYHESKKEKPRPHMGVSLLGHPCDRWLWLSFRWAIQEDFPGRILRLFRRGHHEENWIVQDLRAIGVHIRATGGKQSRVEFGSHVSGSLDGIIEEYLLRVRPVYVFKEEVKVGGAGRVYAGEPVYRTLRPLPVNGLVHTVRVYTEVTDVPVKRYPQPVLELHVVP